MLFRPGIQDLPRTDGIVLIHTHIKRFIGVIGKTAFGIVQLIAGNAKIKKDAVHTFHSKLRKHLRHILIIAPYDRNPVPIRFQAFRRRGNCVFVLIDSYKSSAAGEPLCYLKRMTRSAKRTIHIDPVRSDLQLTYGFLQ